MSTASATYATKTKIPKICTIEESLTFSFDEVIDVRTADEFDEDRVPWAVNAPVLDSAQRAVVGKLHHDDVLAGHKTGASFVSANIARLIQERFMEKSVGYAPLIYCWRGGMRSHSIGLVLANVGFDVTVLQGGYKAFREKVRRDLEEIPERLEFRVVSGPTGSGKSAVLRSLQRSGQSVLDLEALAKHKGSVLGRLPGEPQPTQKFFETLVWEKLRSFDAGARVWVESESKRIGNVSVPENLFSAMGRSPRVELSVPFDERVRHTIEEYDYFVKDAELLKDALSALVKVAGPDRVRRWNESIDAGDWRGLVTALLETHYDPTYSLSQRKNSVHCPKRVECPVDSLEDGILTDRVVPKLVELCDNL